MGKRLPELTELSERARILMADLDSDDARKIYFKSGRRYIRDSHALEDIYHDFLIELIPRIAYKAPGVIDETTSVTTNKDLRHWVGTCFDYFRKKYHSRGDGKRRKREVALEQEEEELPDKYTIDRERPEDILMLNEEETKTSGPLMNAVEQLPEWQRDFVIAYYYQKKPYSVIASEFGISTSAVGLRKKAAMKNLRAMVPDDLRPAA